MKKVSTVLIISLLLTVASMAQTGYIIQYLANGPLYSIDLTNAQKQLIGTTISNFGAGDFGANEVLYAINSTTNELYQIDTVTANATLIGSIPPPPNHLWTGMAYDNTNDIMYGYSAYSVSSGEGSLHIVDVSNATYSTIGTQSSATAIACIALDGNGQMYGLNLEASAKLYQIDINNGAVSLVGPIGQGAAGMGHGMDFSTSNQTMYLTTYNSSTFANTLRTVDLLTGATTQVGALLGAWTSIIAIPEANAPLSVDFTANTTDICAGDAVQFTDLSVSATSWSWTFEGGTPSSSTDQNPLVTYNNTGTFDVTLEVSDGTNTETDYRPNMISVSDTPTQPNTPDGPTQTCTGGEYTYTTQSVPNADDYTWDVTPADAGTITGTGISGLFTASDTWTGAYTIKVLASSSCGSSAWSSELSCNLDLSPTAYFLSGTGSYCEGGVGLEVILDGSDTGVDYELFFENISTGTIMAGTGNALSFGFQTDEGLYTVDGITSTCTTLMFGEAFISINNIPGDAIMPTGDEDVCAGSTISYQTTPVTDADTLIWMISPTDAGIIEGTGVSINIIWSENYFGLAYLSVYGSNDCGDGNTSAELEITVSQLPQPVVIGEDMTCINQEEIYYTENTPDNTYNWYVEGGNVTSGSGTSEITVYWSTLGQGSVYVSETSTMSCENTSDTLAVTVDDCTGIEEFSHDRVTLYPNPASSKITIKFFAKTKDVYNTTVTNQYGQVVYINNKYFNAGNASYNVNVANLSNGIYFVNISSSTMHVYNAKFEVVK